MKTLKKALLWLCLLTKRLYKKPTFPILLLLIPALCFCYGATAGQDSGVVTLALACEAPDAMTEEIFAQLAKSDLMHFRICESPEQAELLVRTGKADEAWIFPENFAQRLETFVDSPEKGGLIRVLQRENSVLLGLSRETLSATLFNAIARQVYLDYMLSLPGTEAIDRDALLACYDQAAQIDQLFTFRNTDAGDAAGNYLLTPLRGLLGTVIVLGTLAAAMYYMRDVQRGTFCWVRPTRQHLPELASLLIPSVHLTAAASLCLALCGLSPGFFRELATVVLYGLCVGAFAMLLRRITRCVSILGILLPVLAVGMLILCPVFFDLAVLRPVQILLPPTYYINAASNPIWLAYMALYTCICGILCRIIPIKETCG